MNRPNLCFEKPTTISIVFGCIIILGTLAAYGAQWVSIIRSKSSEGLSWVTLSLGLCTGMLTAVNGLILNWKSLSCCSFPNVTVASCIEKNLVSQQLIVSALSSFILSLLFLVYFDHRPKSSEEVPKKKREYLLSLVSFFFTVLSIFFIAAVGFILYFGGILNGDGIVFYANALGSTSGFLTVFIWLPQLWTTWSSGSGGSLSLFMLMLQGPGSGATVYFQIASNQTWTTWVPYAIAGTQQTMLIAMLIYYKVKEYFSPRAIEIVSEEYFSNNYQNSDDDISTDPFQTLKGLQQFSNTPNTTSNIRYQTVDESEGYTEDDSRNSY